MTRGCLLRGARAVAALCIGEEGVSGSVDQGREEQSKGKFQISPRRQQPAHPALPRAPLEDVVALKHPEGHVFLLVSKPERERSSGESGGEGSGGKRLTGKITREALAAFEILREDKNKLFADDCLLLNNRYFTDVCCFLWSDIDKTLVCVIALTFCLFPSSLLCLFSRSSPLPASSIPLCCP